MKEENDNKKKKIKIAIIICVGLILILILLLAILKQKPKETQTEEKEPISNEVREEKVTDFVRVHGERDRMQVYIGEFIKHIEFGEYDLAYSKLHPDFKNNYFKTEQEFETYAKKNYPSLMMLDYENIQRQGNYYILTVKITSVDEYEIERTQNFVIQENGINDYYLSFQVKQ